MKKVLIALAILAIVLLACGEESKVTGRKIVLPPEPEITGGAIVETETSEEASAEQEKTAAELLETFRTSNETPATSGASLYPNITTNATGEDALKAKTKTLMSKGIFNFTSNATGIISGPKYHTKTGKPINLPDKYGEGCEHCDD